MIPILHVHATLALLLALSAVCADEDHEYTNDFAVEIDGDLTVADLVAGAHNLRVVRHVCFHCRAAYVSWFQLTIPKYAIPTTKSLSQPNPGVTKHCSVRRNTALN